MNKLLSLLLVAFTIMSCSTDASTNTSKTIKKVVFYLNSPNQKQWNFSNNLLTTITLNDGTVVEQFTYDNANRLITDTKFANGVITEVNSITYNSDNTIKTIDGLPYEFNASTRTYTYSYGSGFTINCEVNSDGLATNFVRTGTNPAEYRMNYTNSNMTSFEKVSNDGTGIVKNFHFDGAFSSNPIRNSVLAIAKVKSLTDPSFFIDNQASTNIANGFDKGLSDPFYYNFGQVVDYDYFQIGVEVLDSNNNPVDYYNFATYYY